VNGHGHMMNECGCMHHPGRMGNCGHHNHYIAPEDRKDYLESQRNYLETELKEVQAELERLGKARTES